MTEASMEQKAIELIKEVISDSAKKQFMWQDISGALAILSEKWTAEHENLFASLLEFEGTVRLSPDSDIPGVMAPEDILKSTAIQNLTEWKGRKYLSAFKKLKTTTKSEAIAEVAQIHIDKILTERPYIIKVILRAFSGFFDAILKFFQSFFR
jgi:hypothetical protein